MSLDHFTQGHHFCIVMQNSNMSSSSRWLFGSFHSFMRNFSQWCEIHFFHCNWFLFLIQFAQSCEIAIYDFLTPLCHFSIFFFWLQVSYLQSNQILIQTNSIASSIRNLAHHQHYLPSSSWFISFVTHSSKSHLKMTPNLTKLVSNSCKDNNHINWIF